MSPTPDVARRRAVQESLLRDLEIRFGAAPDLPVLWRHLVHGFATAVVPYGEEEIRAALADLVERGLVKDSNEEGLAELPEKGYRILPDGRSFLEARCPWQMLDRFSGEPPKR